MALTNSGFAGTVTDVQYAKAASLTGVDSVDGPTSWKIAQFNLRTVFAAPGTAYAKGVLSENPDQIVIAIPTPTNGQWFLIVRRINWTAKTVELVAVAGITTSTTVPTAAPTVFPTTNNTPGGVYDHVLGWVWSNSVNTNLLCIDLRTQSLQSRLSTAVATVATAAERDVLFPFPRQGDQVFRTETGRYEQYHAAWSQTNGNGRVVPGWYSTTGTVSCEFILADIIVENNFEAFAGITGVFDANARWQDFFTIPPQDTNATRGGVILRNPGYYTFNYGGNLEYTGFDRFFLGMRSDGVFGMRAPMAAGENTPNAQYSRPMYSAGSTVRFSHYMLGQRRVLNQQRAVITYLGPHAA